MSHPGDRVLALRENKLMYGPSARTKKASATSPSTAGIGQLQSVALMGERTFKRSFRDEYRTCVDQLKREPRSALPFTTGLSPGRPIMEPSVTPEGHPNERTRSESSTQELLFRQER
jgi:hypothetical protein